MMTKIWCFFLNMTAFAQYRHKLERPKPDFDRAMDWSLWFFYKMPRSPTHITPLTCRKNEKLGIHWINYCARTTCTITVSKYTKYIKI